MGERCIANESLGTTGFSYTLSLIQGKYKMTILYTLMEFGVVRNNVYKLAVTKIDRLGHPRISDNDPDPIDPDDPDEKSDVYLTVSVEVLPWTVRINNIEF